MKSYVIAIKDLPESMQCAKRCKASVEGVGGLQCDFYPAITPRNTDIYQKCKDEGIDIKGFKEMYSRTDNCIAAFLSHFSLWQLALESSQPTLILEHDAVAINNINSTMPFDKCITISKPSYGQYNTPNFFGQNSLQQKPYFGGAHGYIVNSKGAGELIKQARVNAMPTDIFLNITTFPWLQEHYPWKIEVKDSFTTIQKIEGCVAKHNYGETYGIL